MSGRKEAPVLLLASLLVACAVDAHKVEEIPGLKIPGLKLPESVTAVPDDIPNDPDVVTWRPAIRIMQDGATMAGDAAGIWTDGSHSEDLSGEHLTPPPSHFSRLIGDPEPEPWPYDEQLYDPNHPDDWQTLLTHLAVISRSMARETFDGMITADDDPDSVPAEPLLIRADEFSRFYYTQKVMENGGYRGVQIWKYQLATSGGKVLRVYLPKDAGVAGIVDPLTGEELNTVKVMIKVQNEGNKLDESGARPYDPSRDMRFIYDDTRKLSHRVGPKSVENLDELEQVLKTIQQTTGLSSASLDARPGTVTKDVVEVYDRLILAGFERIVFVGSYED